MSDMDPNRSWISKTHVYMGLGFTLGMSCLLTGMALCMAIVMGLNKLDSSRAIPIDQTLSVYLAVCPLVGAGTLIAFVLSAIRTMTTVRDASLPFDQAVLESDLCKQAVSELDTACVKLLDRDCRVLAMNQACVDFLEAESSEPFIGQCAPDVLSPRDQVRYRQAIADAVAGEVTEVEYELVGLGGTRRWMYQRAKRIDIPGTTGDPVRVVCMTREVTQSRLAKDRLEHAINVTNQGLWDDWIQTGEVYYNENWYEMLGYEPGELPMSAQTWYELLHPEDLLRAQTDFNRHVSGETDMYRCEYRLRTKDDSWKWILDVGRVVERSENGIGLRAIGVHIDIDQSKRLELALRSIVSFNSNNPEDSVLKHICKTLTEALDVDIACISSLADHDIPAARLLTGWSPAGELMPLEYALAGTPCEHTASEEYCHYNDCIVGLFPDDHFLLEVNARSYTGILLKNASGSPIGLLTIVHSKMRHGSTELEATMRLIGARAAAELERYQIENELHHTRERLLSIAERLETATNGAGLGVFEYRYSTGEMIWDDTMHSLYGTTGQKVTPSVELWESRLHPDDLPRMQEIRAKVFQGLDRVETTFRVIVGNDQIRHLSVAATVSRSPTGEPISLTGVNWDVTNVVKANQHLLRAKEIAESASNAKSEFLANMSHEIRTPLTAILGYTELLTGDPAILEDPENLPTSIKAIQNNAEHLLLILNDILDLSKIDAGMMQMESVETEPAKLIQETALMLSGRARAKNISLVVDYATEFPSVVESDPTRMRQILLNLIGNAIKFTENGGITVNVSYQSLPDRSGMITIAVKDTGIGISPENIELLRNFNPFTQADGSTTRKFGGTGLGLRLTNAFAQKLGGGLMIESSLGQGSTFTVSIGVGQVQDALMNRPNSIFACHGEPRKDQTRQSLPSSGLDGLNILLVEDGPDNQKLLTHMLTKAGAEVMIAQNGREAIAIVTSLTRARTRGFDLVLMDMQMPEIDGYSATGMLRELGYTGPIIALTAHAMEGDKQRCIQAGCQDYLTKPVSSRTLVETCQRWQTWRWPRSAAA